jgi:hypothetical protein
VSTSKITFGERRALHHKLQDNKDCISELSVKYQVLSQFTAYLAVKKNKGDLMCAGELQSEQVVYEENSSDFDEDDEGFDG